MGTKMELAHSYADLLKVLECKSPTVLFHLAFEIDPPLTHDVINHEELQNRGMISSVVASGLANSIVHIHLSESKTAMGLSVCWIGWSNLDCTFLPFEGPPCYVEQSIHDRHMHSQLHLCSQGFFIQNLPH